MLLEVKSYFFKFNNSKDWILRNISLKLEEGETLLIVGPNGSGKSTLVYSMIGIAQRYPSEYKGEILYKGKDITKYERGEVAKSIGIVQQDPEAQIVTLTVEDEVAFALENLLYDNIEERIEKALKVVGLYEKRKFETHALSYGEKQKLMLASILALDDELLIFDEPTSNLDPLSRKEFFKYLRELKRKKLTMIIIEHNLDEILDMIDKVLILNKSGECVAFGDLSVLFSLERELLEELGIWLPYSLEVGIKPRRFKKLNNQRLLLRTRNINFSYGKKQVLFDINLDLYSGKLYAIIGHNGAGKTTLCKILARLIKGFEGKIEYFVDPKRIRFCFQNPDVQLLGNSVLEEIEIAARTAKKKIKPIDLLKEIGLAEESYKNPHMLSQGQKRLLTIFSSLVYEPELLILDEPTFALDRYNTNKVMGVLSSLVDKGATVLYTTHDIRNCLNYADEIIVMRDGRIIFKGEVLSFVENIGKFGIPLPSYMESIEDIRSYLIKIRGYEA